MRQYTGIGGLIQSIQDPVVRTALQRLNDDAFEKTSAITALSKNKSADSAQVVVARAVQPLSAANVKGTEMVNAGNVEFLAASGSVTDYITTNPVKGNIVVYVFIKEVSGGPQSLQCTIQYGYNGSTETITVINDTLQSGGILTAVVPVYTDGSIPLVYGVLAPSLDYDLYINVVSL